MCKEEKTVLRKRLLSLRAALSPTQRAVRDRALTEVLLATEEITRAPAILGYAATRGEADLTPFYSTAIARGQRVFLPRCHGAGHMTFAKIRAMEELIPGRYGILEPRPDAVRYENETAVCLVPALAFDRAGYRLGYGGGYYDRFLSAVSIETYGVIDSDFFLPSIPHGALDRPCRHLVTEWGVYDFI